MKGRMKVLWKKAPLRRIAHRTPQCAALLVTLVWLSSCAITRTETDYYTITDRDTTYTEQVRNVPGSGNNNGVVFPSSRVTETHRYMLQHDSTYDRKYPNFLRAGGLETAGLLFTSGSNGFGPGLLGIFGLFDLSRLDTSSGGSVLDPGGNTKATSKNYLFKGWLMRVAPFEWRLRWFNDAPDWTVGWSAYEVLAPDEDPRHWLTSAGANVYVRRRFWLRDRIPYLVASPFLGFSLLPSMYVNLGGELHFGSIAGLNLRAYAGFASGFQWGNKEMHTFPYLGLGMSVMDFTNRVEETEREWKDYVHSGININIFEGSLFKVQQDYLSIFDTSLASWPFRGAQMKLASVELPLPVLNGHFWAGTSLLNYMLFGFLEQGLGVLPIRAGYRQYLFAEDLMVEPFVEYNYYPSHVFNIGARVKLDTKTHQNVGITLGYASGNPGDFTPTAFNTAAAREAMSFSTAYIGVSFFLGDWNWSPEQVAAMRASEH